MLLDLLDKKNNNAISRFLDERNLNLNLNFIFI